MSVTRKIVVLRVCLVLTFLVGCGGSGGGRNSEATGTPEVTSREAGSPPPNIVVVVLDDWGWRDYGSLTPGFITPNIDAIAAEGFVFDNAFLTTSSCSPSRASILMGRYPSATNAPHLNDFVPDGFSSIPEVLRGAGYYTEAVGKWHLGPHFKHRFNRVRSQRESTGESWPLSVRELDGDRPFFLWLASFDPHVPHDVLPEFEVHDPDSILLPAYLVDTPGSRAAYADYMNSVHRADHHIGLLLDELAAQGLSENTWVFLLSDNGAPTPLAKTTLYDAGLKTPLLVLAQGIQGSFEGVVSSVDLAPTIVALAGIEAPPAFQGKSFLPVMRSPEAKHREFVFAEQNNHRKLANTIAVRSEEYLLIRSYYAERVCGNEMVDIWRDLRELHEQGGATPLQSLCFQPMPPVQFLQVGEAGYETSNLVGSPAHAGQLMRMTAVLDEWEAAHKAGACRDLACARAAAESSP